MDLSGWGAADSTAYDYALFSGNGNTVGSCSNTAGVTTCTGITGLPVPPDGAVCISGNSVSAYNSCFTLTNAIYTGAGCATQSNPCAISSITFNQGGSPATGTG